MNKRNHDQDQDWQDIANLWEIRPGTHYLNHGSFGPPPRPVRQARRKFIDQLDAQPMDFYLRQYEPLLDAARTRLARFLGTSQPNLVFIENATFGMNIVADNFPLSPGDEVLINNHEYGAVHRIWNRACERSNAHLVSVQLPEKIESKGQVVDSLLRGVTDRTRLIVVSHITSATALILPIQDICDEMRRRNIAVCVDGPHAPAQVELKIDSLNCDFYTASCHKWLSASLGSGFLYANPRWHERLQPQLKSWGRLLPAIPEHWTEEFTWSGTRDPSCYLSIPAAIDLMEEIGIDNFRSRSRWLAEYGENRLIDVFGFPTMACRESGWYGSMAHVRLPEGNHESLQKMLWERHQIEVPVFPFEGKDYVRLSCHLYNSREQIDRLVDALRELIT